MKTKDIILGLLMLLAATTAQAQINIGGKVFGGARQANVGGHTYVNISAQKHDVIINAVYGGNDIAGTIGSSTKPTEVDAHAGIDFTNYNTFVHTEKEAEGKHLFIGQLFGSGYGVYNYDRITIGEHIGDYVVKVPLRVWDSNAGENDDPYPEILTTFEPVVKPEVDRACVDLHGGTFGYVYGGGDNVTVKVAADICINNTSTRTKIDGEDGGLASLTSERLIQMGINTEYYNKTVNHNTQVDKFLFSRVFGGNNLAPMQIRPTWHLQAGSIENLYSGGNEGPMNSQDGLLMEIGANSAINVNNLYGGCRKADVQPLLPTGGQVDDDKIIIDGYSFPAGLSARVLVRGGDINNVYGGNDVAGKVTGGNAVGVYHSISGSIYGGGNGSYPYTDNDYLKDSPIYGDFYYDKGSKSAVDALNDYRPNAEQVSIRVKGSDKDHPTIIGGSIYCGGNSATLKTSRKNPMVELKIGSYVIAENVFLGNNGENMIKYEHDDDVLKLYAQMVKADGSLAADGDKKFNSMDLTDGATFAKYMDGCASTMMPSVLFDGERDGESETYVPYSTYFGSFFCGGNVGSMIMDHKLTFNFSKPLIVYDKVVGGCNNAFVLAHTGYNALYEGGILGDGDDENVKIVLNFNGLKIQPLRMPIAGVDDNASIDPSKTPSKMQIPMVWNTIKNGERNAQGNHVPVAWNDNTWWTEGEESDRAINSTMNRRFDGGNIYGGCCTSGIVNGNVVINIGATIVDRDKVFDEVEKDDETGEDKLYGNTYNIKTTRTGVILDQQGMDVLGSALNIFGGGKGVETEIWGSTTINLNRGYVFQIFGGSEKGAIGKRKRTNGVADKDAYGRYVYEYDSKYSTCVNLSGSYLHPGVPKSQDMSDDIAEAEFLYGGGFAGPIAGNTRINLNHGRIFNSFAGSCNADIQGYTETYIGQYGFPYVRDYVYGGNDLGGKILGAGNFTSRVRTGPNGGYDAIGKVYDREMLNASAYVEYNQGRVEKIFGGCYGVYDYTSPLFGEYFHALGAVGTTDVNLGKAKTELGYSKPHMGNAFINFRPSTSSYTLNYAGQIFGAGQGYFTEKEENLLQESSYILIDVPLTIQTYQGMEVFGGGECGGVGMGVDLSGKNPDNPEHETYFNKASAIIDLARGQIKAVYGGSYQEGITRRTVVNVPVGSTIRANNIFGGAYGRIDKVEENGVITTTPRIDVACDVYEAIVNYSSDNATIDNAIYGGNNACRRTLYGKVNINSPVWSNKTKGYTATVYGAGCGVDTWSQYTEVNLNSGASVYEVYGGGEDGKVMNTASVAKWKETEADLFTGLEGYTDNGLVDNTPANSNRLHEVDASRPKYYNTNVHINNGATVGGYCYGGGLGHGNIKHSGNVYGTTYIDLLGGKVVKDLYAAGTTGSVKDSLGVKGDFIASATAYIEGGSARNVYGGGWKGSVGHHNGVVRTDEGGKSYTDYLNADYYNTTTGELIDIPGETHVVIGLLKEKLAAAPGGDPHYHLHHGIPYVERNAYGGGEGGAVWGTTNITMNNGYIGYVYNEDGTDNVKTANIDERYEEKIVDDTYKDDDGHFQDNKRLNDAGCIFGGGYVDNSSVDFTLVKMYGGHVRNALFGGGEIAAVGRGKIAETIVDGKAVRSLVGIYRPGKTEIKMFDGYVHRNVFGGGRGYNNLGESGSLFSDGYVFGQTSVNIHGGEIGTEKELIAGNGNVFGGGDIGYVYSAYEYTNGGHKLPRKGVKDGVRYDGDGMYQGYYYEHDWADDDSFIKYQNGVENSNGDERKLTEDCKVVIEPYCKAKTAVFYTIKYSKDQIVSDNNLEYLQSIGSDLLTGSIDAYGKVTATDGISFDRSFTAGQYVPTSALNTLGNRVDSKTEWDKLEANTNDDGIIIHNAVFAGGNTSSKGSDNASAYANSTSVYGNATASIHDVYHRDLITIGTGHIGGLYGDGNLTLVDGYRGLNITNYGTDYHYLYEEEGKSEMSIDDYNKLLDREKDYYELRYKCLLECRDIDGTTYHPEGGDYSKASTLTLDDILTLFPKSVPNPNPNNYSVPEGLYNIDGSLNEGEGAYWIQNGVCSIYAGRILNTIQRADFCGVFGSRMVMQGAQDRVPEVVDYTKYTINRVREVSLNKKRSVIQADLDQSDDSSNKYRLRKQHGNYFGIYSIVNYLGALTSDFDFGDQGEDLDADDAAGKTSDGNYLPTKGDVGTGDVRTSDNINTGTYGPQYENQTFYGWKRFHYDDRERNNGNSHNKVALASGVYLELTTEESTGKDLYEKVWGPITGVVELDLINVQSGLGGGFVYAKNIHGVRTKTDRTNTTLTALNAGAATRWDYTYEEPSTTSNAEDLKQRKWQTSGNFVHSTQTIIDDCYNVSNKYLGPDQVPAHYWYIKGSVYVYDQYISAYTGATNAYSEKVDIPLTITAASHGQMKLLNVQPNRYAYYNTNGEKLNGDQKLIINDIEYKLNDPISYWDWYKLTAAEKRLFEQETYVSIAKYKYTQNAPDEFPADQVLLPADYTTIMTNAHHKVDKLGNEVKDDNNNPILELWDVEEEEYVPAESIIRSSNNLSHDTGYILTYRVNNPTEWDTWYTEYLDASNTSATREKNQDLSLLAKEMVNGIQKGPNEGPTYRLKSSTGELLGQRSYKVSDIISQDVKTTYDAIPSNRIPATGQATFQRAWVATGETDIQRVTTAQTVQTVHLYQGSPLSATEALGASNVAEAYVCTKTIKLDGTDNIYVNSVMTATEKTTHLGNVNTAIGKLVDEINTVLSANSIENINAATIANINSLTPEQLNKITALQKKELIDLLSRKKDINDCILPAYYCIEGGLYGGDYYASGINYRGLEAWSSMSEADRDKFIFNYDALDLLIDPTYDNNDTSKEGLKYQYDGATYDSENDKIIPFSTKDQARTNSAGYSLEKPVEYTATYNGSTNDKIEDGTGNKYLETTVVDGGKVYIGDELTREQFELLPNDQRHYAPITVTSTDLGTEGHCTFYIVKEPLMIGQTPYTTGNIISKADFDELNDAEKTKVTQKTFNAIGTSYFCREAYDDVPIGTFITSTQYEALTNYQKGFIIHGIAPTETSTLYVSRFSDIDDLSKEKIITVIYEYNYEESDVSGLHITPVTERHVLNIHINFKTGAPIVEDIDTPPIVIPGHLLSLLPPEVIEGASPIQGGGWELYPTESDADNHNGVEYIPDTHPLYWYQNGYWLRYYALSYVGGKTYSNKVQVSVANYHDLKEVMDDKEHHYYIDIPDLNRLRDPKIYIKDATNGMNQLKNLFDLSLQTEVATTGETKDHALLKSQVKQCDNLEFIMQTNVNHTGSWMPIGQIDDPDTSDDDGVCFKGNIHGDGYYISGLNNSLFANLCGNVYNLGVTGSFTGAGVVDEGIGYVENCWTNTTGNPDGTVFAVFGNPSDKENPTAKQIVNSYYQETKPYKTTDATHGLAIPKSDKAFYNGEVAYDLNGFYLWKRYWDHNNTSGGTEYTYYTGETDPTTGLLVPQTEYYGSDITYCSSGYIPTSPPDGYVVQKYVEDRYADGDFRYAGGEIQTTDERMYIDTDGRTKFYPIWPDDYLFFGQMLTYNWKELRPHEDVPSPIVKDGGRLLDTDLSNRVYRAPAYYRNSEMDVAHFNPNVNLVAYSKPKNAADKDLKAAYPGMTAIDFKGYNDTEYVLGPGTNSKWFYQPLLDDDGLQSIVNRDETHNLLVYAPSAQANLKTYNVLNDYFVEPEYADYYLDDDDGNYELGDYRRVLSAPQSINGHLVQDEKTTTNDHLLVDKEDFNCPIDYTMGANYRMWYQRTPSNYVGVEWIDDDNNSTTPDVRITKGWESISLPFTAELVTTNDKGEITHFFSGSEVSKNGTGTKIGHEYWLRAYRNINEATGDKAEALFTYPKSDDSWEETIDKNVTNTFLWDYYYNNSNALSGNHHLDANTDVYQTYYNTSRSYDDYPQVTRDIPYIIGFPGVTYYEFDLSGKFGATTTAVKNPQKLSEQVITFASDKAASIRVSDDYKNGNGVTCSVVMDGKTTNYTFKPNYLNEVLTGGKLDGKVVYTLNAEGSSYDVEELATPNNPVAFRPYFTTDQQSSTRSIVFADEEMELKGVEEQHGDPTKEELNGGLRIWTKKNKIYVESTLSFTEDMRVVTPAGITVATFTVKPGQTVEVQADFSGMYVVHTLDGKYTKKVAVKK